MICTIRRCVALLFLVGLAYPAQSWAQVTDPTTAEFEASDDHWATSNGTPLVDHYELEFYLLGAAQPFQVQPFGKPSPQSNDIITIVLSSILSAFPAPAIVYESAVAAVGPGGRARSGRSNTFRFTSGTPCSYGVSPTSRSLSSAAGSSATTTVTAAGGCGWTATSNAGWLSITGGSSGSGSGTVTFSATANSASSERTGTLTVAGQTVTVTQSGTSTPPTPCTYSVSPTFRSLDSAAGSSATTTVTAAGGCGWTATSNAGWLSITGGSSGSGNGTVTFSATANSASSERTGTLTVAGQMVTVTQNGTSTPPIPPPTSCTYSVSPTARSLDSWPVSATTAVTTAGGCGWTATSNASWLTISGGSNGTGSGTVTFSATANTAPSDRTGSLTVAGQTVMVTQDGGAPASCTYSVSPTSPTIPAAAGSSTTTVTTGSGCGWTATSGSGWLTISGSANRSGSGSVTFNATANPATTQRTGTLSVAGQTVSVTQSGACTFSISPTERTLAATGETSTSTVTTGSNCSWTTASHVSWLTVSGGTNGTGTGIVTFSASSNSSTVERVGTMTIAGRTLTVTQRPLPPAPPSNLRLPTIQ